MSTLISIQRGVNRLLFDTEKTLVTQQHSKQTQCKHSEGETFWRLLSEADILTQLQVNGLRVTHDNKIILLQREHNILSNDIQTSFCLHSYGKSSKMH